MPPATLTVNTAKSGIVTPAPTMHVGAAGVVSNVNFVGNMAGAVSTMPKVVLQSRWALVVGRVQRDAIRMLIRLRWSWHLAKGALLAKGAHLAAGSQAKKAKHAKCA